MIEMKDDEDSKVDDADLILNPNRFLVVTANQVSTDYMLDCFESSLKCKYNKENVHKIVRLGKSSNRGFLDKKYSLDRLANIDPNKNKDLTYEEKDKQNLKRYEILDKDCSILIAPIRTLQSPMLDKYFKEKPHGNTNL